MEQSLERINTALVSLRKGKMVILVDEEAANSDAHLILPAEKVSSKAINFMSTEAKGLICLALDPNKVESLKLPLMSSSSHSKTAFTLSIDKKEIKTGSSAQDRAETIKTAIHPKASPHDLVTPGHIFPLKASQNGVLEKRTPSDAAVDLMNIAKMDRSSVICQILNNDGELTNQEELKFFSRKHHIPILNIKDIIHYRLYYEALLEIKNEKQMDTAFGPFTCLTYADKITKNEHFALIKGKIKNGCLLRIHQGCLEGDVFLSKNCHCKKNLHDSLNALSKESSGILFYHPEPITKDRCQHSNLKISYYALASQLLKQFDVTAVHVLMTHLHEVNSLKSFGISVLSKTKLEP